MLALPGLAAVQSCCPPSTSVRHPPPAAKELLGHSSVVELPQRLISATVVGQPWLLLQAAAAVGSIAGQHWILMLFVVNDRLKTVIAESTGRLRVSARHKCPSRSATQSASNCCITLDNESCGSQLNVNCHNVPNWTFCGDCEVSCSTAVCQASGSPLNCDSCNTAESAGWLESMMRQPYNTLRILAHVSAQLSEQNRLFQWFMDHKASSQQCATQFNSSMILHFTRLRLPHVQE
jgi:hypothetical protein